MSDEGLEGSTLKSVFTVTTLRYRFFFITSFTSLPQTHTTASFEHSCFALSHNIRASPICFWQLEKDGITTVNDSVRF